jgi:hypothetical protein
MSLIRKHCEEFLKNPSINPKTGRKIAIGKVKHKQLMEDYFINEMSRNIRYHIFHHKNNIVSTIGTFL